MYYEKILGLVVSGEQFEHCMALLTFVCACWLLLFTLFALADFFIQWLLRKLRLKAFNGELSKIDVSAVPLKRCPLCNGEVDISRGKFLTRKFDIGRVYCPTCGITTPKMKLVNAALIWNNRYTECGDAFKLVDEVSTVFIEDVSDL